ncbi:MAG: BON domain-containing protein [Sterolibacteriaceae bacterium]|jgi:hypothetical protein|nr:BON domain-containing protein [Sterolibacteriaceae bacterium]
MKPFHSIRSARRTLCLLILPACLLAMAVPGRAAQPAAKPARQCDGLGDPSFFRDEGINIKVSSKLKFNKSLMREIIQTKVNGGIVTLSGNVSTAEHARLAAKLASAVGGVRCVNNDLVVGPPAPRPISPY